MRQSSSSGGIASNDERFNVFFDQNLCHLYWTILLTKEAVAIIKFYPFFKQKKKCQSYAFHRGSNIFTYYKRLLFLSLAVSR